MYIFSSLSEDICKMLCRRPKIYVEDAIFFISEYSRDLNRLHADRLCIIRG